MGRLQQGIIDREKSLLFLLLTSSVDSSFSKVNEHTLDHTNTQKHTSVDLNTQTHTGVVNEMFAKLLAELHNCPCMHYSFSQFKVQCENEFKGVLLM